MYLYIITSLRPRLPPKDLEAQESAFLKTSQMNLCNKVKFLSFPSTLFSYYYKILGQL